MMCVTTNEGLREILSHVAQRMQVDLESSRAIQHSASKGAVRERDVQRNFLAKYLPGAVAVSGSGELVSADGQVSQQCDLMVVDADTPPLWSAEDYALVPVECCQVTIEVKSNLTASELRKSWLAARRAKSLPRAAYLPNPSPIEFQRRAYGKEWAHAFPLRSIVFGYEGATLDTLAREMSILASEYPDLELGIDAVCVLNRGVVSWIEIGTGTTFERRAGSVAFASSMDPGNVLLFMVAALNDLISQARYNDKLDIKRYITGNLGSVHGLWLHGEQIPTP